MVCFHINAATWTLHGFKDNFMYVKIVGTDFNPTGIWQYEIVWDWGYDQVFPLNTDSGLATWDGPNATYAGPYQDVWSISTDLEMAELTLSGGYPGYAGGATIQTWLGGILPIALQTISEAWIDFDSVGNIRASNTQPSDFGKWAWDGSINPHYVGPLTTKHHGHK